MPSNSVIALKIMENFNKSSKKVVFVTGASRSGTTMLSRVLDQHSEVLGLHELHIFGDVISPQDLLKTPSVKEQIDTVATILNRQDKNIWQAGSNADQIDNAKAIVDKLDSNKRSYAQLYLAACNKFTDDAGKRIACEQTPRNIFYARELLDAMPEAYIVHMLRDPRAVLASQKSRWSRNFLGTSKMPFKEVVRSWCNYHPITLSKLWCKANQIAIGMSDHPRFHILRFESILEDPQEKVTEICEFLGVEFEPKMLEISVIGSSHLSIKEEKKGIAKEAANNWITILTPGERQICEKINAQPMRYFDYSSNQNQKKSILSVMMSLVRYPVHVLGVALTNPRRAMIQLKALLIQKVPSKS